MIEAFRRPLVGSLNEPMLAFGLPPHWLAWLCVLLAVGLVLLQKRVPLLQRPQRWVAVRSWVAVGLLAGLAAAGSWAYWHHVLHGIPRIIDATAYWLAAKTMAAGDFTFAVPEPSAAYRGRFLLADPSTVAIGDTTRLGVIFPPGYPALLGLGFRLGMQNWVGPLLAAALVLLTYALAFTVTGERRIALAAACFSTLCAALRYQTADTMSHGWSTVLATGAVLATAHLQEPLRIRKRIAILLVLGACLGLLLATRQLTGTVFALACVPFVLWRRHGAGAGEPPTQRKFVNRDAASSSLWLALGAVPGLVLLLAHQHALTGSFWLSPQLEYYRLSDGPPGCFGLGLGKGCVFEHGDVVERQGGGLGLDWMLLNTLHRLHWFSLDVANFELLALVPVWWLWSRRRERLLWPAIAAFLGLPFAYAWFYFPGSYPGGGARFFSELLPIAHVGLAAQLIHLGRFIPGLATSLAGFAVHGIFLHVALAQGVDHELALVATDPPASAPLLARDTGGPLDAEKPPVVEFDHRFNVLFDPSLTNRDPSLANVRRPGGPPPTGSESAAVESEHDWPPTASSGVWAHPTHVPAACVSGGRGLLLHFTSGAGWIELEATGLPMDSYQVTVQVFRKDPGCRSVDLGVHELPARLQVTAAQLGVSGEKPVILDRLRLVRLGPRP